MKWRGRDLFAGGGIHLPGIKVTALTIVAAFIAGILIGWFTALLPNIISALSGSPEPGPTVSPEPAPSIDPTLLPQLAPIFRDLDADDIRAGLTSLEYPYEGDRTFTVVPGGTNANPAGPPVRWVSIEIEGGLSLDPEIVADFVMDQLSDPRGWGANDRLQYARTDGVADYRVVFASPLTAATMCGDFVPRRSDASPTATVEVEPVVSVPEPASVESSPSPSPTAPTCDQRGMIIISAYDWAAGLQRFGFERTDSRTYQLLHEMGRLAGNPIEECASGRASVMVDQRTLDEACTTNPWPFPDAVESDPESTDSP
ncbi:MAG: hypothetical protein CVT64_09025 [Actinobacteria bacterium HGW-Actinobacteria-4]|nr:MAG: hypothetical protein CVT64_09025 [Actinobacteria bacterium HGW-Actinobacteria-4]